MPSGLLCPGWLEGRGQCECLFLTWLMGSSITHRYSYHSPITGRLLMIEMWLAPFPEPRPSWKLSGGASRGF